MSEKSQFKFYMPDGSVGTMEDLDNPSDTCTSEFIEKCECENEAFLTSNMYNEWIWRDRELHLMDRLMFEDSQYQGDPINGTSKKTDVLAYRKALYAYDMKYDSRPLRPEWYTGFAPGS